MPPMRPAGGGASPHASVMQQQLPSASALPGGQQAPGQVVRPPTKGLPMSVLLEVIQQHPALKSRIHEIVSRRDLSEPDKMAQIQLIVREAGAAPSNSQ